MELRVIDFAHVGPFNIIQVHRGFWFFPSHHYSHLKSMG